MSHRQECQVAERNQMNVVLISTYELGRQPFGLASPAAWLRKDGAKVTCLDLSRESLQENLIRDAGLIAFYVPMHTATRLAIQWIQPVRELNPKAHLCFYGLYAPVNEAHLRELGASTILGGEFEQGLVDLASRLRAGANGTQKESVISLGRQNFLVPDRTGMSPLADHARLLMPSGETRTAGYTEASRGCKHLCRHCPIVPVYQGAFRIVGRGVVLEDIRRQVGVGAEHITFGDPDFFNGPAHALAIVKELHREFPRLTYDVTIKIEHLLQQSKHLPVLRDTGCLFVTSAIESVDDAVLEKLDKRHTRADFLRVVELFREIGLVLQPTFVPFSPWTSLENYCDLLQVIRDGELIENVAPIQLAIRLLVPAGSRLLELAEIRDFVGEWDGESLVYKWRHKDSRVDDLWGKVLQLIHSGEKLKQPRSRIFQRIWEEARRAAGLIAVEERAQPIFPPRAAIPYLNEPWYC